MLACLGTSPGGREAELSISDAPLCVLILHLARAMSRSVGAVCAPTTSHPIPLQPRLACQAQAPSSRTRDSSSWCQFGPDMYSMVEDLVGSLRYDVRRNPFTASKCRHTLDADARASIKNRWRIVVHQRVWLLSSRHSCLYRNRGRPYTFA